MGEIAWQMAHGETPDAIKNHPALKGLTIPRTGRANGRIGVLVTKSAGHRRGARLRHDAERPARRHAACLRQDQGKEVGAVYMAAPQTGSPMTYMLHGRQYLVLAISGAGYSGELIAFAVPRTATTTQ